LEITDLKDIHDIINDLDGKMRGRVKRNDLLYQIWFRGQKNYNWELTPGIFRDDDNFTIESKYIELFKREYPSLNDICSTEVDWLSHMQHYGIPTRLLDWSENILIALFFATESTDENNDGKLSILNAYELNKFATTTAESQGVYSEKDMEILHRVLLAQGHFNKADLKGSMKYIIEKMGYDSDYLSYIDDKEFDFNVKSPVAFFPKLISDRMKYQSSVFTIHGGFINDYNSLESFEGVLLNYKIPNNKKLKIRKQLFNFGVHEGSIYPELENQSKYLKFKVSNGMFTLR
jgi:hypothetical protein